MYVWITCRYYWIFRAKTLKCFGGIESVLAKHFWKCFRFPKHLWNLSVGPVHSFRRATISTLHNEKIEISYHARRRGNNKNNNTDKRYSFQPCSISLYLSLPRKLIGLLDPSSLVRLMASTWSLPDCGWWRRWDCFWFCFTPIRRAGLALVSV